MSALPGRFIRWCHRPRRGGQSGFTLVEVLLTVGIAALILAPVGGWMMLALRTNGPTVGRFTDSAQSRLLDTYVTRDVSSAESVVTAAPKDCEPATPASDTNRETVMNVVFLDTEQQIVVYQVHSNQFGEPSLFRRTCEFTAGRTLIEETEVLRDVQAGSVHASCSVVGTTCKTVTFTATLASGNDLEVRATVRASLGSLQGNNGTFRPEAVIGFTDRQERTADHGLIVSLTASDSNDLDSDVLTFAWSADGQSPRTGPDATFEWQTVGTYRVTLTVTDDQGNVSTARETVRLVNQPPTIESAAATVGGADPVGEVALSAFDFTATATDPDSGVPLAGGYSWTLDGSGFAQGPSVSHVFPLGTATGSLVVLLVVTDGDGGQTTRSVPVTLNPPGGGTTTTTTTAPSSTTTTTPADLPTAAFVAEVGSGAAPPGVQVSFQNSSTGTGVLNHVWSFGIAGASSTAADPEFLYTNPGNYIVNLTVTDSRGSSSTTKPVNIPGTPAAPASPGWSGNNVTWTAVPGAAQYRVAVTNFGTHPDGSTCIGSGVSSTVDAGQPLSVSAGSNTCPNPQSSATLSVLANNWSPPSAPSVKP